MTAADLPCRDVVELVSDYLAGELDVTTRARFEDHLALCEACVTFVDQIRTTVATTARLRADDIPPETLEALVTAFRDWHA